MEVLAALLILILAASLVVGEPSRSGTPLTGSKAGQEVENVPPSQAVHSLRDEKGMNPLTGSLALEPRQMASRAQGHLGCASKKNWHSPLDSRQDSCYDVKHAKAFAGMPLTGSEAVAEQGVRHSLDMSPVNGEVGSGECTAAKRYILSGTRACTACPRVHAVTVKKLAQAP